MPRGRLHYQEEEYEGVTASRWLERHTHFINKHWSTVRVHWCGEARQSFQDEKGNRSEHIVPAHFIIVISSNPFSLFRKAERTTIEFQQADVLSLIFRRDKTMALLREDYYIHISLKYGKVEITRTPPFYGSFSFRSDERVRVRYLFNLKPYKT